jgi:hypothetical protein
MLQRIDEAPGDRHDSLFLDLPARGAAGTARARGRKTLQERRNHKEACGRNSEPVYVLNNFRKHVRGARGIDPCSSARWFDGWRDIQPVTASPTVVATARTWLARAGWRVRHALIHTAECPRRV